MSRTQQTGLTGHPALPACTKRHQKQLAVLRRSGLLACICALSFLTAHLSVLAAQRLPFEDTRLKADLGGMVIAALVPFLVLAGFAGRRHRWGVILALAVCGITLLASTLPF